jgi:hypothetical protein
VHNNNSNNNNNEGDVHAGGGYMGSTEAQRQVSGQPDNGDDRLPLQEVRWGSPVCYQEQSIVSFLSHSFLAAMM